MKKFFVLFGTLYSVCSVLGFAQTSPVVQVVSYSEPLGLYFSFQGWGSGSIIDQQGHIITNNHVVDDGMGGVSDNFGICITDDPTKPPRCHYTASVIDRNPEADIAILRIDETDIFGKKVDFGSFSVLPIDTQYVPQSGDQVIARGYPWVGANTLTETQGIVAGTAQYNNNTYIKTDTLIAGGNSGGPLIRDGKMVGVNTFLIGGGYDPSLGYSLLISQVSDFIRDTISEETTLQSNSAGFPVFLQKIDSFAVNNVINDPLIRFRLADKYAVVSYIPGMSLEASLVDGSMYSVTNFGFYHTRTPHIADENELKNYILHTINQSGNEQDYGLNQVTVGGRTLYELVDIHAVGQNTKNQYIYVSMLDETHLLILFVATPTPTKNTSDTIQKSLKNFLDSIDFPAQFAFPEVTHISLPSSDLGLRVRKNASISYSIGHYDGLFSYVFGENSDFVMVRDYLTQSWNKAQIAIFGNSFETEDMTIDEWMKMLTEESYRDFVIKKKITYKGYEGFMVCDTLDLIDKKGIKNDSTRCEVMFLAGNENEYIISTQMVLPPEQTKRIDTLMIQYINRTLIMPAKGDTLFVDPEKNIQLPYDDVDPQTTEYKNLLKSLISLGVLQNRPQFEGDSPLTWEEYIGLYVWFTYHKKLDDQIHPDAGYSQTFRQALSVLPIIWADYAQDTSWELHELHALIRGAVSGQVLRRYDTYSIQAFLDGEYSIEGPYADMWKKIVLFENQYFGDKTPLKTARYTPIKDIRYNMITGISTRDISEIQNIKIFGNNKDDKKDIEKTLECQRNAIKYFSQECQNIRKESLMSLLTYTVLTKGKAVEILSSNIDTSLWKNEQK